jgi:hypothetical protein
MAAEPKKSPLSGYNHNLKYKGRIYHVQTEDSGIQSPHVFTHLFHDGTIIATIKSDYDEIIALSDWEDRLRKLMQEQHKNMMKSLLRGQHDEKIQRYFGAIDVTRPEPEAPSPAPPSAPAPPRPEVAPPQPAPPPAPSSRPEGAQDRPPKKRRRATAGYNPQPASSPSPSVVSAPVVVITDLGSQKQQQDPNRRQTRPRMGGSAHQEPDPPTQPPAQQPASAGDETSSPSLKPEESEAIPENIFGDVNVVDEKSLDEVILAYLSEDLPDE